jgi:hypothetical protein
MKRVTEVNPVIDQYTLLIMSLATSKHCPYSAKEMWDLPIDEFLSVRHFVHLREAQEWAMNKDQIDEQEKNSK